MISEAADKKTTDIISNKRAAKPPNKKQTIPANHLTIGALCAIILAESRDLNLNKWNCSTNPLNYERKAIISWLTKKKL